MATEKEALQDRARELGIDPDQTVEQLKTAIDAETSDDQSAQSDTTTPGIATPAENAALEHSEGGSTTRDDRLDAGVPMLQGDPSEPTGPEDALGQGPKRGDYRDRVPGNPMESIPNPKAGQPVMADDGDGGEVVVDYEPHSILVAQKPRTEDIGDVAGEKGGVTTSA